MGYIVKSSQELRKLSKYKPRLHWIDKKDPSINCIHEYSQNAINTWIRMWENLDYARLELLDLPYHVIIELMSKDEL